MKLLFLKKTSSWKNGQLSSAFWASFRLLKIVWQVDPGLFISSIIAYLIPAILPFVNAYIYKLIIDFVVSAVTQPSAINFSSLYILLGARVVSYFVLDWTFSAQAFLRRLLWTKVPITLNDLIFAKTSSLDSYYFENSEFNDLLERVRDSYSVRPQNLIEGLLASFQSIIQVLIALIALVRLNWIFVFILILVALPELFYRLQISKMSWGVWSGNSPHRKRFYYLSNLLQNAKNIKEIRIFQLADNFLKEIKDLQTKFYLDNKEVIKESFTTGSLISLFSSAIYIGIEIYIVFLALGRKITVGDINFYTSVVDNFQNGVSGLFRNLSTIFEQSLYVKSIFEVLDLQPIIKEIDNPVVLDIKQAPRIEFKNVSFAYPQTKTKILNNFSLTIEPGEKIAFVGENGAGKTTIIKLLSRFYDVDEGEILINGINIKDLSLDSWYHHFGVLFQDFNHYEHTVKENIGFGKVFERVESQDIIKASISAGAHGMIEKLDNKYDQMLGRTFAQGIELSGGQWQKVALARAFLRSAPVLVLDEPTSAIDAKAEAEIFGRVEKLSKDKTVIIISHRFSTVRNADKIYVLEKGKIAESGTHESLMKDNKKYANLFRLQAKGYQ